MVRAYEFVNGTYKDLLLKLESLDSCYKLIKITKLVTTTRPKFIDSSQRISRKMQNVFSIF